MPLKEGYTNHEGPKARLRSLGLEVYKPVTFPLIAHRRYGCKLEESHFVCLVWLVIYRDKVVSIESCRRYFLTESMAKNNRKSFGQASSSWGIIFQCYLAIILHSEISSEKETLRVSTLGSNLVNSYLEW